MGSWPLQRGSILSGSEARSWPRCRLFSRCGFRRQSTMSLAQRSCTTSASEAFWVKLYPHAARHASHGSHRSHIVFNAARDVSHGPHRLHMFFVILDVTSDYVF